MGLWAGCLGSSSAEQLRRLLGPGAEIHCGAGYTLGVANSGGELATLGVAPDGRITASIGCDERAGCSATLFPTDRTLTLACDPFGLHSIYTAEIAGALWFASDLRLLRRLLGTDARLDPVALHAYLCFSCVPAPLATLSGVQSLSAGTALRIDSRLQWREVRLRGLKSTSEEAMQTDEGIALPLLRDKLRAAVQNQIGNAREVGVFLSGGLDSSLIAALLAEAGVRLHLFSLDFGAPYDAELPFAHAVAAHLGRPLHVVPCGPRQVKTGFLPTAAALEQPFGDAVTVPLYLLGKAAAQTVGIVFNGEGGDQLFGGWNNKPMIAAELYGAENYDREAAYLATYHRFYGLTDRLYTSRARNLLPNVDIGSYIRPALTGEIRVSGVGYRVSQEGESEKAKGESPTHNIEIQNPTFDTRHPTPELLHLLRAANLQLKGAQNIAPRARQLAAAHGLRVRSPFFDPDLAAWTFTLPSAWSLQGACEKYLLKRVAEAYLPSEIVWREKRGMGVPATEWCIEGLRREIGRLLAPRRLKREGWFDPGFITALRRGEDHPGEFRRRRLGEKLWLLALLAAYQEAHSLPIAP
jgi:asparagine synthase (glutamine-hydrolysing)